MAAICNGIAAHGGLIPYCATFLNFTGYALGAIRVSALSRWGVIFVATHDSIGLGEDGPTHQPVEALINLRATPNVLTLRPADANEVSGSYMLAIETRGTRKTSTPRHSPTARRPQIPSPRNLRRRHADGPGALAPGRAQPRGLVARSGAPRRVRPPAAERRRPGARDRRLRLGSAAEHRRRGGAGRRAHAPRVDALLGTLR